MSRALPITREALIRRLAAALDQPATSLLERAGQVTDDELLEIVENAEQRHRDHEPQHAAWRPAPTTTIKGRFTTAPGITR